ncbi:hypothetical protein PTQ19_03760 [Microbacterium esteraromaticum]|uniref:hypothetical protein n=1 Tax=Microbacterium esteraromaticum TaxID=57043 RepID=UPI001CD60709|nr:hypothetical protein [Microbacterium esteraromaticum]MCA1305600.1 hypothetical protein [Microbacterium esteraromaticum]WDH79570.1 hypothetical protein PTQ19_03760 [Microbacterium esteraromaticum]
MVLTSCAPQGDVSELAIQPPSGGEGADSALLDGVLRRDSGCTYIERDTGERVVLVFQEGDASWLDDNLVFTGAAIDVVSATEGEHIMFAGSALPGGPTDEMTVPDGCRDFTEFWNVPSE